MVVASMAANVFIRRQVYAACLLLGSITSPTCMQVAIVECACEGLRSLIMFVHGWLTWAAAVSPVQASLCICSVS